MTGASDSALCSRDELESLLRPFLVEKQRVVNTSSERRDLIWQNSDIVGNEQCCGERWAINRAALPTAAAVYDDSSEKQFMTESGGVWLVRKWRKMHGGMD